MHRLLRLFKALTEGFDKATKGKNDDSSKEFGDD